MYSSTLNGSCKILINKTVNYIGSGDQKGVLSSPETTRMHAKSLQLCLTLCSPMDHSQLGSSVHWILQAGILEWVAMPSSRGSSAQGSNPSLMSPALAGRFLALAPPRKPAHLGDRSIKQQQQQHNKMQHDKGAISDVIC